MWSTTLELRDQVQTIPVLSCALLTVSIVFGQDQLRFNETCSRAPMDHVDQKNEKSPPVLATN